MGYQQGGIKANKYLYQEKEFQDGLNLNIYDFHARGYDPAIGRTMQMDPHAENYLDLSPYSWGANNPISIIDPTGMDTVNYNNVDWKNFKTDTDVLGLDEVVFTFGSGNYPSLSDINGQNQKAMSGWVDAAQMGLDVIGMTEIPFVSQGAELVSAGISFGRGDTFGGLIGLGSMIPILGKTFEATKIARYAAKGVKTQWGWSGTKVWKNLVDKVRSGGTIENFSGKIPTKSEALKMIEEAGGKVQRIEGPHLSPNPHNYNHINYTTPSGGKGTIKIQDL